MRIRPLVITAAAALVTLVGVQIVRADTQMTGAGSSFDYPFFSRAFYQYSQMHTDVSVDYQSIGSGAGTTAASATAGCSIRALSSSKGLMR